MEQYTKYPIIQVDGGFLMIDKKAECLKDTFAIFPNTINGKIKDFEGCLPVLCNSNYAANEVYNLHIVAHTCIGSLKNSNLPLFEMPNDPMVLARKAAVMNNYDFQPKYNEFIKSLNKYPISAEVEMENKYDETEIIYGNGDYSIKPKVDKNNYLIIKQFNYE
jgi:hypothetical protein